MPKGRLHYRVRAFTLLEIMVALVIFSAGTLSVLTALDGSMAKSYNAQRLMEAQNIVDQVMGYYRLNPFSEDSEDLGINFEPYQVSVNVSRESINILPEQWQQTEEELDENGDPKDDKKRIILRVTVDVGFEDFNDGAGKLNHHEVSTLIRHIELAKEDGSDGASATKP